MPSSKSLYQSAISAHQKKHYRQALKHFLQLLRQQPKHYQAHYLLGDTFLKLNQPQQAAKHLQKSININPNFHPSHFSLAVTHTKLNQHSQAIDSYLNSLILKPNNPHALGNLGNIYLARHQYSPAIQCYKLALNHDPDYAQAHFNLANAYRSTGLLNQALHHYQQATRLSPQTFSLNNYGLVLEQVGQHRQALKLYRRSIKHHPQDPQATSSLVRLYQHTCAWKKQKRLEKTLDQLNQSPHKSIENPFNQLCRVTDPHQNYLHARKYSRIIQTNFTRKHPHLTFSHFKVSPKQLKIGYFSNDYRDHPIGHQIHQLFGHHNTKRIIPYTLYYGSGNSDVFYHHIHSTSPVFVNLHQTSPENICQIIYQSQINILVDTTGYTESSRTSLLSSQPAPIQIAWLGFPGSQGSGFHQYLFTDPIITPPKHQKHYSEKLVYLPHCYQISPNSIPQPTPNSAHPKLPPPTDFACFNHSYKITPQLFKVWTNILQKTHSSLTLFESNQLAKTNLSRRAKSLQLTQDQLVFAPRIPLYHHLQRLSKYHLCLDTTQYTGGANSSHSLLAGTPIITLLGHRYVQRMTSSLLCHIGLSECITHSLDQYQSLAIKLIRHPQRLNRLKRKLAYNQTRYPLFDTARFTQNLETTYTTIWSIYQAGHRPKSFHITDPLPLDNSYIKHK